jgi:hypothetical protein
LTRCRLNWDTLLMPCDGYRKYKDVAKGHRQQANYLRFNGPFAGKRKTAQMIADAERKASEADKIALGHLQNCPECSKRAQ